MGLLNIKINISKMHVKETFYLFLTIKKLLNVCYAK